MIDIDRLKEIFLKDVDEDTRAENLEQIRAWEQALLDNENYKSWLEHDVTKRITVEARRTFTELSMSLATRRDLTEQERQSIYGRQDAMRWLLSLTDKDPDAVASQINADIHRALSAVS